MDLYCQHCDEPWEVSTVYHELGDENKTAEKAKQDFLAGVGCPSCEWGTLGEKTASIKSDAMWAMAEMLGDDVDGMASMMDDFEYMGMLDD